MSEYREKEQTLFHDQPLKRARPVVESRYDSVVHRHQGMSGGAIAALVMAAMSLAVVVTMLIMQSQQRNSDEQSMQERERIAAAQQTPTPSFQQPPALMVTPSPPVRVPETTSAPVGSAPAVTAPSSAELEISIASKLQDDEHLRSYPIEVSIADGVATLSGNVPNQELRMRAERLARRVKGVQSVDNNITVQPQ
jgi:BON domain-containing protein